MICLVVVLLSVQAGGCAVVGPASVSNGRAAYNDVITRTNAEQTLEYIVRTRYADPVGLLKVSSVTANISIAGTVGGEVGVGSSDAFAGNLVPFSIGGAYEENPTISYLPVEGESFIRAWLAPLSLETLILTLRGDRFIQTLMLILIDQMNALRNPLQGDQRDFDRFRRAVELLNELQYNGIAHWTVRPDSSKEQPLFQMVLTGYAPDWTESVQEFLDLLEIEVPVDDSDIDIPVRLAVTSEDKRTLNLQTRSVADIMFIASADVQIPDDHLDRGVSRELSISNEYARGFLRVRSAAERPTTAMVAIKHRGWWFYVDDTDVQSKEAFMLVQTLFLMRLADAQQGNQQVAPILTVPVG